VLKRSKWILVGAITAALLIAWRWIVGALALLAYWWGSGR
jgi:hypothetical protein